MSHLGRRVTSLVDGQLPPQEAEVLHAHVATCGSCRALLDQERASRAALSRARDVEPDPELTARLLALSDREPAREPGRGRLLALAGGGVAVAAGAVAATLVIVGGLSEPRADPQAILGAVTGHAGVRPADLADVGSEETTGRAVAWMEEHGWSPPAALPHGMRVVDVEVHHTELGEILDIEIAGAMAHVRLLQQRGVLTEDAQATLVAGQQTVGLTTGVRDVAVQSGDCVVLVLASAADAPLSEEIRDSLPAGDYDTSVGARLVRGWQTLTEWGQG